MSYKTKVKEEKSVLASGFIPTEPEEINAQWLFEVINQYREVKNLSLLKKPDDILECEINERLNSRGYLSSTYIINCKFKVISFNKAEFGYCELIKIYTFTFYSSLQNLERCLFYVCLNRLLDNTNSIYATASLIASYSYLKCSHKNQANSNDIHLFTSKLMRLLFLTFVVNVKISK